MDARPRLVVFTDLDGTLLDHETYRYDPALEALEALRAFGGALVLASSKTAAEIAPLRKALGAQAWPAITENGAGLLAPFEDALAEGATYSGLRQALDALPAALRQAFSGFGDLSVDELSSVTGLSHEAARLAQMRSFSEPGIWRGNPGDLDTFVTKLAEKGITAQQGGRFLTLSYGGTKADRVKEITAAYAADRTLALGDAPNDIGMLEAADIGIIVKNPHGKALGPLKGEAQGTIIRTAAPGPDGWNEAVLAQLARFASKETAP
ncbi:MAG: HAD-IIB family hydrolase [Pseudomonadota bacterium]